MLLLSWLLGGCASILNRPTAPLTIESAGQARQCRIMNADDTFQVFTTPATVRVPRKLMLRMVCERNDSTVERFYLDKKISSAYWLNIPAMAFYGAGLAGFAIDGFVDQYETNRPHLRIDMGSSRAEIEEVFPTPRSMELGFHVPLVNQFYLPDTEGKGLYHGFGGLGVHVDIPLTLRSNMAVEGEWAVRSYGRADNEDKGETHFRLYNWHTAWRYQRFRAAFRYGLGMHFTHFERHGIRDLSEGVKSINGSFNQDGYGPSFSVGFRGITHINLEAVYQPIFWIGQAEWKSDYRADYQHFFTIRIGAYSRSYY
jgi:hypothetical protein